MDKMEIHINDPKTQKQINEIYPPWDEEKELKKAIIKNNYNELNAEEKAKEIKEKYDRETIINPIFSREKQIENYSSDDIPDDDEGILQAMITSKNAYDSREVIKDEIIHFVRTYPDKTFTEYIALSFNKDNLVFEDLTSKDKIFKLDKDGRPIFVRDRELHNEDFTKLWNILHNYDGLSTYSIVNFDKKNDGNNDTTYYNKIKDELIKNSYNTILKQDIETYIKKNTYNTYEDWIKQHDIFKKYVIDDSHIFSIMYLDKHPALHYWNEYSNSKKVIHRTKVNEDPYKPNDPNIYVYKIENKKP